MAPFNFLLKRTSTANKRPNPSLMAFGELNLNYDAATGGVFYKDANGEVRKVGPAEVGAVAPNTSPVGTSGLSVGELWYDTTTNALKVWSGTAWLTQSAPTVTRVVGRMWWETNAAVTVLGARDTWKQMVAPSKALGNGADGFALHPTILGLQYTGTVSARVMVTARGRFDSSPGTQFKFGIAKTATGTATPATDLIADSVFSVQDSKVGDTFMTEVIVILNPNDVIYPVVENTSSSTNITVKSASFTARSV